MKLPTTVNWPTLRRKLLAGLIAVGLAYAVGYYWPRVDPTDSVRAFCAGIEPGMPIAQVLADAVTVELSTTLGAESLQVYRFRTGQRVECRIAHSGGFVTAVQLTGPD